MSDTATKSRESQKTRIKEPKKYKVLVLNDDYTPMDFVIEMFMSVFRLDEGTAHQLTMKIHEEGSAVAGVYSYEVAEQKALTATKSARDNGHPLMLKVEEEA